MQCKYAVGIVCYNPIPSKLDKIVINFGEKNVIIFNNGCKFNLKDAYPLAHHLGDGVNCGLGKSSNEIIKKSLAIGCEFLVLSDQDSCYPHSYAERMIEILNKYANVIAVFPAWRDLNSRSTENKKQYVEKLNGLKLINLQGKLASITHSIASGVVINLKIINENLLFNEGLFVDWVDTEWCWRVNKVFGYECLMNNEVTLLHELADSSEKILGREFSVRSVLRDFYIIRNATYILFHQNHGFKRNFYTLKKILHHILFSFVVSMKKRRGVSYIYFAIKDGLCGTVGEASILK